MTPRQLTKRLVIAAPRATGVHRASRLATGRGFTIVRFHGISLRDEEKLPGALHVARDVRAAAALLDTALSHRFRSQRGSMTGRH